MTGFASFAEVKNFVLRVYRGIKRSIYSKPLSRFKAYKRYILALNKMLVRNIILRWFVILSRQVEKKIVFLYANEIVNNTVKNVTPPHHRGLSHVNLQREILYHARQASTCLTANFAYDRYICAIFAAHCMQLVYSHNTVTKNTNLSKK